MRFQFIYEQIMYINILNGGILCEIIGYKNSTLIKKWQMFHNRSLK